MKMDPMLFEVAKLVLQLVGAVIVARLAVRWALSRYKSEKTWERRLAGYADAVTAISDMRLVVGDMFDEAIERRDRTDAFRNARNERYQAARRRLEDGVATALLLLPNETAETLNKLLTQLQSVGGHSYEEQLDNEYGLLDKALHLIIEQGRAVLGIEDLGFDSLKRRTKAAA